jgi:hypothetical protein
MMAPVAHWVLTAAIVTSATAAQSLRQVPRQSWVKGHTSITGLMEAGLPVVLTDTPARRWAATHWRPKELRQRLDLLYNVRRSGGSGGGGPAFTYFTGSEWKALFGSPMERAAARQVRAQLSSAAPSAGWRGGADCLARHARLDGLDTCPPAPHTRTLLCSAVCWGVLTAWHGTAGRPTDRQSKPRVFGSGHASTMPLPGRGNRPRPLPYPHQERPPHEVLGMLDAQQFFDHVLGGGGNASEAGPDSDDLPPPPPSPPVYYYSSGALDEKVVVREGSEPLLPELMQGLMPSLEPYPHHDWRPHLWLVRRPLRPFRRPF